ncbi:hypothetical protein AB0M12_26005, partial [Nocardia vinacea]
MTSPLVWDAGVEPAVEDADGDSGEGALSQVVTPWTRKPRQGASPGLGVPGQPGAGSGGNSQAPQEGADPENKPALPGPAAEADSGQGSVGSGGKGVAPPAGAAAPGAVVPGQQAAPTQTAPAQAPPAQAAPAPAPAGAVAPNTSKTTDDAAADPTGGLLNPDTLTALAPTAMMAGAMMLP